MTGLMNEFDLVYDMSDEPTLQEFQLAVQAELVKAESIPDKEERIKRQTQIEITLNELLKFRKKYSELKRLGLDPFREIKTGEDEPMKMSRISQTSVQDIGFSGISCTKCSAPLEQDLDFCSSCGKER